jgi:hypothetical protein
VAEHIAIGVGAESDVGRDSDTSKHELASGEEPVDVVPDADAKRGHLREARRSSIVRTAAPRDGNDACVASWTMEPGG